MTSTPMPDDVRRFIQTSVASVPYLEALLLMRREPNVRWSAPLIARRLYCTDAVAQTSLTGLHQAGIAILEAAGYRYGAEPDLDRTLGRLAVVYAEELVGVTTLIHSRIDKRATQFADAFRIRKKGD